MANPTFGEHAAAHYPDDPNQAPTPPVEQGSDLPPRPDATPTVPPRPQEPPQAAAATAEVPLESLFTNHDSAESAGPVRRPHRLLRVALALAVTAGVGGGIAYATQSKDKPSPRPAAGSTPKPGTPSHAATSQPTPSPSPTESIPYDGSEPTLGGKYYAAKTYDPTTAVAVPYTPGQKPTKAIVETLLRDVDVAITSDDVNQLLYAGIEPTSELAQNIQAGQMNSFESDVRQAGALSHVFNQTLDDRDIKFDPNDPNHAQALVRNGSDFDLNYAPNRITYNQLDLRLGHKDVTLPDGQSEDIWRIQYQIASNSTFDQWLEGYQQ